MKKILMILIVFLFAASSVQAGLVYDSEYYKHNRMNSLSAGQNDPIYRHLVEAGTILFPETGDATVWYVNSNVTTEGDGTSWTNAFDTLNEGIGACSAGDFVYVAEGHNEAVIAADGIDADVAGITIKGFGSGTRMPTIDYDHADGEFVIGAANVTLINLRFNASVTIVTHAIDVENAGDYATIAYCEFPDGETAATDEFVDTIQVGTTATDVTIIGCNYFSTGTGSNNFVDLSAATISKATVVGNTIYGAFAEAGIWGGAAVPTNALIAYNTVTNTTSGQFGIEFAGNATGILRDNVVSTDAIGTSYDVGYLEELGTNLWDDYGTRDTSPVPWTTNETGVNRWGATELAQIEGEATDALEADHIDHLFAVSVADEIADDSYAADIAASDGDWSGFDKTTDSLEAIADCGIAILADTAVMQPVIEMATSKSLTPIATGDLFAVAGGPIRIIEIIGVVTDTVQNQANSIKLLIDPTAPATDTDICAALEINADAIGTVYTITGTYANAMVATTNGVVAGIATEIICPIGMIELNGTASNTGTIVWYIRYIPLSASSTVTAQ